LESEDGSRSGLGFLVPAGSRRYRMLAEFVPVILEEEGKA
jgi:hypothetical protein